LPAAEGLREAPVSVAAIEDVADRVEGMLQDRAEKEIGTSEIGAFVMEELKGLDKVAYVRFASVYRHFRDIGEFMTELKDLLKRASARSWWPRCSR
jgi:transcriptional repressor NrdR